MRTLYALSAVLITSSLALGGNAAAQPADCAPFKVYLGDGHLEVIDLGKTGLSLGDERVGSFDLEDADGAVVGLAAFKTTVVGANDGRYRTMGSTYTVFDNGTLHYNILNELSDPSMPKPDIEAPSFEYLVIGGTKTFAGVHGVVETSLGDDGRRVISFDIACDR